MKRFLIISLHFVACIPCQAFDPIGLPPEKTLEWTSKTAVNFVAPIIDFDKNTTAEEACDFLQMQSNKPKDYCIEIDTSALSEKQRQTIIVMQEKNISLLTALSKIADRLHASLVIEPGKICLVPRK